MASVSLPSQTSCPSTYIDPTPSQNAGARPAPTVVSTPTRAIPVLQERIDLDNGKPYHKAAYYALKVSAVLLPVVGIALSCMAVGYVWPNVNQFVRQVLSLEVNEQQVNGIADFTISVVGGVFSFISGLSKTPGDISGPAILIGGIVGIVVLVAPIVMVGTGVLVGYALPFVPAVGLGFASWGLWIGADYIKEQHHLWSPIRA